MHAGPFPGGSLAMCIQNPKKMFIAFDPEILLAEIYQREINQGFIKITSWTRFLLDHIIKKTKEQNKYSITENWLNVIWNTM